jgi:Asp-tRNA(Asn)/Glu-tRNA(Gln) amidotransferase A subunit family amidase
MPANWSLRKREQLMIGRSTGDPAVEDGVRYATLPQLRQALDKGELSAVEVAAITRDAVDRFAPAFNGLASLLPQRSMAEALAADQRRAQRRPAGPLDGIPYAAKDLFAAAGAPTTWGSPAFRDQRFDTDAVVIARLTAAGGVLVAKASMVELAGAGRAATPGASLHGQGRNPWDPARYSGGSSSGSGILVALGLVPYALGSETGGSVVGPAAYLGVTGIRPTFGLVPRTGVMQLSATLDKVGVLARTAEDCAAVMAVIAGPDAGDPDSTGQFSAVRPEENRGLRIAAFAGEAGEWDQVAASALAAGRSEFESLFPHLAEVQLPMDGSVNRALETIINDDAAQGFREYLSRPDFEMSDARQLATLREALELTPGQRTAAREVQQQSVAAAGRLFDGLDAVVMASRTDTARPLDRPRGDRRDTVSDIMRSLANLAGLPGVSFPCGLAEDGMPVGLQLIGPRGSDARLLAAAQAYQERTGHHLLRPPARS